jgi:RNA polymerase sigma-70 factor (ECF subfamily)
MRTDTRNTINTQAQPEEEHEWIARAQAGDKAAFGQLVQRYQRLLVSVAYHQGLDLATAEDVAQETFIKAWLALPRFQLDGNWKAWLCRIAINTAADAHRRTRPTQILDESTPDGLDVTEHIETRDEIQTVRRALNELPAASRVALTLREYEGLSYAEIAATLDIPIGTVMSRLNYARRRLREMLEGTQ